MSHDKKQHTGSQRNNNKNEAKVFLQAFPHIIDNVHWIQLSGKKITERLAEAFFLFID